MAAPDGWCAVTWQEKSGFAIQSALDLSGRVPVRRESAPVPARRAYGPPPGYVVEEPPVYYGPPPPVYYGPYWRRRWYRW